MFLEGKMNRRNLPVINLKYLNQFMPFQNFKMEGLYCLKGMLQEGDFLWKLDIKEAHFSVPLHQSSREYIQISWSRNIYEILDPCFGLGLTSQVSKSFKSSYISTETNKYLSDNIRCFLMVQIMEEILESRGTIIFHL